LKTTTVLFRFKKTYRFFKGVTQLSSVAEPEPKPQGAESFSHLLTTSTVLFRFKNPYLFFKGVTAHNP
jgi:hypothetical protein